MNFLRNIDQQTFKYDLSVNKDQSYRTAFGGCLFLLLTIISVLSFVAFGRDLINKKGPTVYTSLIKVESPVIKKDSFISYKIAGGLMLQGGFPIPDVDRMVSLANLVLLTNPANEVTTVYKPYLPDTCIDRKNYTDTQRESLSRNFIGKPESYKCLSEGIVDDMSGSFGESVFTLWAMVVSKCQNSTANNNSCFSNEEIQSRLGEFYLHLIFEEYYVDSDDYENPVKVYYNKKLIRLSSLSARQDVLFFRPYEYISDNGFLMEDRVSYFGHELVNHEKEFSR